MNSLDQKMLQIKSLDRDASVEFSTYTHRWYVSARIEIGDGTMLTGISRHSDYPEEAVNNYFHALTTLNDLHYLVTGYDKNLRLWKWNGAAFAELKQ